MNKRKLFTKLNKLCEEMNNLYDINSGGCCFVAACLAKNLEKLNIPFKIIHYNLCGCHYAIKVKDRYINRDNYIKSDIITDELYSSEDLFKRYYNSEWNRIYNKKWNLIVSTRITSICNKYANSRTRLHHENV